MATSSTGKETDQAPATTEKAEPSAVNQWQGAFAAYGQAFAQIKKNPQPALVMIGTYVALSIIGAVLYNSPANATAASKSMWDSNYGDLTWLIFLLALPIYSLAIADRKSISLAEFVRFDIKKFLLLLIAVVLASLIFIVSFLLLLVPLIWAVAWFSLVQFPVIDKDNGPVEALKESKRLSQNHKAKVWGVVGVSILLAIPAIIINQVPYVGGVGIAALTILATAVFATLYRWLQRNQPVA